MLPERSYDFGSPRLVVIGEERRIVQLSLDDLFAIEPMLEVHSAQDDSTLVNLLGARWTLLRRRLQIV